MLENQQIINTRKSEHDVAMIFPKRWSPRAMNGEPVTREELLILFEAARWAPSAFNEQPWRFCYALRDTPHWNTFYDLLVNFNKQWCVNAGALIVVFSRNDFTANGKPSRTHSYDTGAAWMSMALQGSMMKLVVHGMSGIKYDRIKEVLTIPDGYTVEAMAAVGRPGNPADLPGDLREREKPNDRRPVDTFIFEGSFTGE